MKENYSDIVKEKYNQDYNRILNVYENEYSHSDLIELLSSGSVPEKQAAVLKLEKLKNKSEVDVFMSNLTGCDGKIREAVSFRLPEFVKENPEFFIDYEDIFLKAVIDINGNICRNTISALNYLKTQEIFAKNLTNKLLKFTLELIDKVSEFDIQDGKYKINKEVFKLYWCLETIYVFCGTFNKRDLFNLLNKTKDIQDYTIREKTAKILTLLSSEDFDQIKVYLKADDNYYVRRFN